VLFVGLHVSIDELNRREKARGDRPAGSAASDYDAIHRGLRYDLEIDAESDLATNVELVLSAWKTPREPSALFAGLS
jgi:chloramphenicol 3-O phosphotransferase